MYNETHARDVIWFSRRLRIINQLEKVAQKSAGLISNSPLKSVGVLSAAFAVTLMLKKLTRIETLDSAVIFWGSLALMGYNIYSKSSIDADLEELKRDLERDEKDLYEIENLMRELQDPLDKLNTFQPLLVKLFQVGTDGFANYMTSTYPSEKDVINKASKKMRQIFYDDNFTSFMLTTNTKVNETTPWDITSMNTIRMFRSIPLITKEYFKTVRLNGDTGILKSSEKGSSLDALNILFTTFDVYDLIHSSLGNRNSETSIQALNRTAYKLQIQVDEMITNSSTMHVLS